MQNGPPLTLSALTRAPDDAVPQRTRLPLLRRVRETERLLDAVVASWHTAAQLLQCRRWHRVVYEKVLVLTPLDDQNDEPAGPPRRVWGRDLSLDGLSFTHVSPLAFRRVAVAFGPDAAVHGTFEAISVRLTWCRFTRAGIYQSGGQFQRGVSLPPDGADWHRLPYA